jgi:hypothetical protein
MVVAMTSGAAGLYGRRRVHLKCRYAGARRVALRQGAWHPPFDPRNPNVESLSVAASSDNPPRGRPGPAVVGTTFHEFAVGFESEARIRLPYSLLAPSRREARFTVSPITV